MLKMPDVRSVLYKVNITKIQRPLWLLSLFGVKPEMITEDVYLQQVLLINNHATANQDSLDMIKRGIAENYNYGTDFVINSITIV